MQYILKHKVFLFQKDYSEDFDLLDLHKRGNVATAFYSNFIFACKQLIQVKLMNFQSINYVEVVYVYLQNYSYIYIMIEFQ